MPRKYTKSSEYWTTRSSSKKGAKKVLKVVKIVRKRPPRLRTNIGGFDATEYNIRRIAKKVMNRGKETKYNVQDLYSEVNPLQLSTSIVDENYVENHNWYAYNLGVDAPSTAYQIAANSTQAGRDGNQIRVVANRVNYTIQCRPQRWPGLDDIYGPRASVNDKIIYSPQPYTVLVLCIRRLDNTKIEGAQSFLDLFQKGEALEAPLSTPMTLYQKLNRDKYKLVYRRVHKVQPIWGAFGDTSQPLDGLYHVTDAKYNVFARGSVKIPTPKKLYFNDDLAQNKPQNINGLNFALVFIPLCDIDPNGYFAYAGDGAAANVANETEPFKLMTIDIEQHLSWKD